MENSTISVSVQCRQRMYATINIVSAAKNVSLRDEGSCLKHTDQERMELKNTIPTIAEIVLRILKRPALKPGQRRAAWAAIVARICSSYSMLDSIAGCRSAIAGCQSRAYRLTLTVQIRFGSVTYKGIQVFQLRIPRLALREPLLEGALARATPLGADGILHFCL